MVAMYFFRYGAGTLSYLYDVALVEKLREHQGHDFVQVLKESNSTVDDLTNFSLAIGTGPLIGQLLALSVALAITLKKRQYWLNDVIAFVLLYLFSFFGLTGWSWLKPYAWWIGEHFNNPRTEFVVNACIMLLIGAAVFIYRARMKPEQRPML